MATVKEIAENKWTSILTAFGIPERLLDRNHRPCPICGGKDRFRYVNKTGHGDWVCNGHGYTPGSECGHGDGMSLLMDYLRVSFVEAAKLVTTFLGSNLASVKVDYQYQQPEVDMETQIAKSKQLYGFGKTISAAPMFGQYFTSRSINIELPTTLRFVQRWRYYEYVNNVSTHVGDYKAMLAPIVRDGEIIALHQTFLNDSLTGKAEVASQKKIKGRNIVGGAIPLFAPSDGFIALAEGIETALSVTELYGWPTWATVNTTLMEGIILPPEIKTVVIAADYDRIDPTKGYRPGVKSAQALKSRLESEGRKVKIILPPSEGMDFNDLLKSKK